MSARRFLGKGVQLLRYVEGLSNLREGDVFLASFPKSGSTWVRFVLANLISLRYWNGRPLDFPTLDGTLPELGVSRLSPPWPYADLLPRVIKTHQPAWPILRDVPAVLLMRDPLDVMVSFFHHDRAQGGLRLAEAELSGFLRHPRHGLPGWTRHTHSWTQSGVQILKYEELREDPTTGFAALCQMLDIRVEPPLIEEAVSRSTMKETRRAEERAGLDPSKGFQEGFRFARRGATGEGARTLSDADREWADAYLRSQGIAGRG